MQKWIGKLQVPHRLAYAVLAIGHGALAGLHLWAGDLEKTAAYGLMALAYAVLALGGKPRA